VAAPPRPVRIPRGGASSVGAAAEPTRPEPRRDGEAGSALENRAATERSRRIFLLFALLLVLLFLTFLAAQLGSPYAGVRDDWPASLALALIALFAGGAGYALTLGRTPVSVRGEGESVLIRERSGRERRIPAHAAAAPVSVKPHAPILFTHEWTETVELEWPGGLRRAYLFERGLLAQASPRPGPDRR
jgi:hypothetical protein